MSNQVVGDVYKQIMTRILEVAKNDFEEGGYAPSTLGDLKEVWQQNLSKLHVAQMPWDPKQQPVPPALKQEHSNSPALNGHNNAKPEIKYEPSGPSQNESNGAAAYASMNGYAGGGVNPMAQQRAANHLLERFGPQANASIQATGLAQQSQSASQVPSTDTKPDIKPDVSSAQTDGAGDEVDAWQEVVSLTRDFELQRPAADGFFRSQMDAADVISNAGLMLNTPQNRHALRKLRKQQARASVQRSGNEIPQADGADEEDEDAINSELDDSEDEMEHEEEDEEGPLGEMILCTWDKVNRVKNKWKCTLKDGVLATGGKEYLFLKATGEFEW